MEKDKIDKPELTFKKDHAVFKVANKLHFTVIIQYCSKFDCTVVLDLECVWGHLCPTYSNISSEECNKQKISVLLEVAVCGCDSYGALSSLTR